MPSPEDPGPQGCAASFCSMGQDLRGPEGETGASAYEGQLTCGMFKACDCSQRESTSLVPSSLGTVLAHAGRFRIAQRRLLPSTCCPHSQQRLAGASRGQQVGTWERL